MSQLTDFLETIDYKITHGMEWSNYTSTAPKRGMYLLEGIQDGDNISYWIIFDPEDGQCVYEAGISIGGQEYVYVESQTTPASIAEGAVVVADFQTLLEHLGKIYHGKPLNPYTELHCSCTTMGNVPWEEVHGLIKELAEDTRRVKDIEITQTPEGLYSVSIHY